MLLLMTTLPLPLYLPNSLYLTNLPNIMSRCGPDFSISLIAIFVYLPSYFFVISTIWGFNNLTTIMKKPVQIK
jgi:hypothetical protein